MPNPVELVGITNGIYNTVAASQSNQVCSVNPAANAASGAKGDYLAGVLIVPGTTSPGAVSIEDDGGPQITIFTGGATSVVDLKPFWVPINARSQAGAWKITTGANVSAISVGSFS